MTRILGISAFYHDSAACLLDSGKVVAALQEERFSRQKHDSEFPSQAIKAALKIGRIEVKDLDAVVFYEKPFSKFERLLETYVGHSPQGIRSYLKAIPLWIKKKIWIKELIRKELDVKGPILFADHHESHAASAFFPSPFDSAAILTIDGVGEWTTTAVGVGRGNEIELLEEIRFPDSLGLLYSAFTFYLGFKVNADEYKVMGLAPYGQARFADLIRRELIEINEDGSFRLNQEYFDYEVGLRMTSRRFDRLFGAPPRRAREELTQWHKDIAASIQAVTEEAVLRAAIHTRLLTKERNLCMAGGVALNCVANGRVLREAGFDHLWVQPAAGDAGGALGSALAIWYRLNGNPRRRTPGSGDSQEGSLLGTAYNGQEIRSFLESAGAIFHELPDSEVCPAAARILAQGGVVGWYQGRMEFGPRALGNRSILADPRRPEMWKELNLRIKYRESFRPFAPAILEEEAAAYFELDSPSPYMLLVAPVRADIRSSIPAVTHVDGSARIQTVGVQENLRFHTLLTSFKTATGCPLLLNTSFNVKGEPIVESPQQAYDCFMRTRLDALLLGNFLLRKEEQPTGL